MIASQHHRAATLLDQLLEHLDKTLASDRTGHIDMQTLFGELVNHRQALEFVAIGTAIKNKVIRPDLVGCGGHKRLSVLAAVALPGLFRGHLQPRSCPNPGRPIPTQHNAIAAQKDPHPSGAVPRILRRVVTHGFDNWSVLHRHLGLVHQPRSGNVHQRTGPSLRHTPANRIPGLLQTRLHAHHFFTAISFITSISRSRSAKIFFNRLFSCSKALSLRTSSVPISPNFLRQAYIEGSLTPWRLATSATGDRSASCNIRTICSSVNLARFITAPQGRGAIVSKSPWPENPRTGHQSNFLRIPPWQSVNLEITAGSWLFFSVADI